MVDGDSVAPIGATVRRRVFDRRARMAAGVAAALGVAFVVLALAMQRAEGTAIDVAVTSLMQRIDDRLFARLMVAVSSLGYAPWSWAIFWAAAVGLFVAGFRREALLVLGTHGVGVLVAMVKLLVERPRPTAEVVRVLSQVGEFSFPSGHVASYVTFYGLLFFFAYALFKRSWWRTAALVLLGLPISLVGVSRIYLGHHWASDVAGGYALGLAYLLILIEVDRLLIAPSSAWWHRRRASEPRSTDGLPPSSGRSQRLTRRRRTMTAESEPLDGAEAGPGERRGHPGASSHDVTETVLREATAHRVRHLRAWKFQIGVLLATLVFAGLALLARTVLYFEIDLVLTRAIQELRWPWLDILFAAVTWVGFPPQSNVIFGTVIAGMFLLGLRFEAVMTFFAAAGSAGLWLLIASFVGRPRPSPELVYVAEQIPAGSFPSGHALNLTAIFGFLLYLIFVQAPPGWWRPLVLVLLSVPILTIGVARVQAGAHWPSDVLGGYLLGGIWLALTIALYRWGRRRLAARHGSHGWGVHGDGAHEGAAPT